MKTKEELRRTLQRIDGRGYKAYTDIRGGYRFDGFLLEVDYVQADPFAPPSLLCATLEEAVAGFPKDLYGKPVRKIALEDYLTRRFHAAIRTASKGRRGTGRSGAVVIDCPSQEVLQRSSVVIGDGNFEVRFLVGLPARGRTILGRQAQEIFFDEIPKIVSLSMVYKNLDPDEVLMFIEVAEDADSIRSRLDERGLVAFVADGAVLPRVSGVDDRPLGEGRVVPSQSPASLRVEFDRPNGGKVSGMGIPKGVTLIVGGGYHGKSTLLNALEKGVYNHIPGDGREFVVADPHAVKIRAEDGRAVSGVDISPFIANLPFGQDTRDFSSQDASGSTSQAANIMEALEVGARTLLVDEDTSATNFMIRDGRMQRLVAKDREPITPFIDKVKQLHADLGVSTILVMGGTGDYFEVADTVIMMDEYVPRDVTGEAREIARCQYIHRTYEGGEAFGSIRPRRPRPGSIDPSRGRYASKVAAKSLHVISFGTHFIDLGEVEQLTDISQTKAIGDALVYALKKYIDGKRTLSDILDLLEKDFDGKGLDAIAPHLRGDYARPRRYEIAAALNRLRTARFG